LNRFATDSVSTVYVVDDEVSLRNSLRRLLNMHGITVETYDCAEAFLVDAGHLKHGCLLLDINMPGLTGLELLEQLRSNDWHVPAVLMTAGCLDGYFREQARQVGAFAILEKPLDVHVLLSTIEQAVIQHKARPTPIQKASYAS
jgi:FixJ family two-component response regulator